MKKRIVSILLVLMMLIGTIGVLPFTVSADNSVKAKLDSFIASYPSGSRWTGTFDGGSQCYGFAKMVLYNVFGQYHGWYYNGTPTKGLTVLGSVSSFSYSSVQSLLSKAKCGDLLQFDQPKQHTMIVYAVDSDGVWVYDCNWDNNCGISLRKSSFGTWSSRNSNKLTLFRSTNYPADNHIVDPNYGTEFTAYPKEKITAQYIYDGDHNQISSTAWIGTSDLCTIHEVYTDGCCRLTYPLDSGGSRTAYSKIAFFNLHTHNFTGQRVYEQAHPHEITQRCVDYATCGGYYFTGEYYQVKTCQQCWHATFDFASYSISLKVGESQTISAVINGFFPDTVIVSADYDSSIIEMSSASQSLTFKGLKPGTCTFKVIVYSDSTKSYVIGSESISITVTSNETYTVSYNANGGTGAPSAQTKYYGTDLTLSTALPAKGFYVTFDPNGGSISEQQRIVKCTFKYWNTQSSGGGTTYYPGGVYKANASATLYAIWDNPVVGTLPTPKRDGYVFDGWYTSSSGGRQIYSSETVSSNVTYYAHWTQSDNSKPSGTISSSNNVENGQTVTLSMNDNVGLAGYYWGTSASTSPSFTSISGASYTTKVYVSSEGTYYLTIKDTSGNVYQTSKTFYKTTLNANGGSVSPASVITASGNSFTLPVPTRNGYTYGGWSTSSSATSGVKSLTPNSNSTYYAVWVQDTYLSSISIASTPSKTVYYIGDSLNTSGLRLTLHYSNGTTSTVTSGFTTSGFNSSSAGSNTVTVSYEGKSTTLTVTIKTPSVTLSSNSLTMSVGESRSITATSDPSNQTIIWSSSDSTIATVSNGVITAKAAGTVNIKAKFSYNGTNYQKNCSVTISSATEPKYVLDSATGTAGQTVSVYLSINNNPGIVSLRNTISYKSSAVELTKVEDTGLLKGFTTPSATISSPYTLRWADALATSNNTSNGRIIKLTFKIKDSASAGTYEIAVNHVEARNVNGAKISFSTSKATITVTNKTDEDNPFIDVPSSSWYTQAVLYCYHNGLMSGTSSNTFDPNATLTRAMFVTILSKIDSADTSSYTGTSFTDVQAGKWYSKPIEWAYRNGYSSGVGNGKFGVNDPVTREQLAVFLYNYSKMKGFNTSKSTDLSKYTDVKQISSWAKAGMQWAVAEGLISGTSATTVSPKNSASRAQVALIVMNYIIKFRDISN